MNEIIIISLTSIPVILWGYFFYLKTPRKQSFRSIIGIFLTGTFSVIPILAFHFIFIGAISLFFQNTLHITDYSLWITAIKLFSTVAFVAFFMVFFSAIKATFIYLFYDLPWMENFRTIKKSFYSITPLIIILLILIGLEVVFIQTINYHFLASSAGVIILLATMEEYCKYIINPFLSFKTPDSISSAVVDAIYVGLAFAFVENVIFFLSINDWTQLPAVFLYRSVFTVLLHVGSSAILGYFYGISYFSNEILTSYEIEKSKYNKFAWLQNRLKIGKKAIIENISITQGFFVATFIHVFYNILLEYGGRILPALLIFSTTLLVIWLINLESSKINYGLVGTREMPDKDFHDLKLRISVLKNLKEIRDKQYSRQTEVDKSK